MTGEPLRVGDIIHGHVGGYFGRDHYECARIEAIGADWIVARRFGSSHPITATASLGDLLAACLEARDSDSPYPHTFGCPADELND